MRSGQLIIAIQFRCGSCKKIVRPQEIGMLPGANDFFHMTCSEPILHPRVYVCGVGLEQDISFEMEERTLRIPYETYVSL